MTHEAEASSGGSDELSERERLFNAYLEGELSEREREAFDARLREDEEWRRDYEAFVEVVDEVQNLPYEFAPPDLASQVRTKIRVRSRGGFFGEPPLRKPRVPYEVIAVVMMIIMASAYFFMGLPPDRQIRDAEGEQRLEIPERRPDSPPRQVEPGDSPPSNTPEETP